VAHPPIGVDPRGRLGVTRGATLERLTRDDLIAKSTAIVRGKVISSYASFRGPIIYTPASSGS